MDALAPLLGSFTRLALDGPPGEHAAPLTFEGRPVGTLNAWGPGDLARTAALVAPLAATPAHSESGSSSRYRTHSRRASSRLPASNSSRARLNTGSA